MTFSQKSVLPVMDKLVILQMSQKFADNCNKRDLGRSFEGRLSIDFWGQTEYGQLCDNLLAAYML